MNAFAFLHSGPRLRQKGLLCALAGLMPLALYLWTAPLRQERALRAASLPELEAASRRCPNDARVWFYLGRRRQQQGQITAAHAAFEHAALLNTSDEAAWLAWATTATGPMAAQDAANILFTFLKQNPDSAPVHLALGQAYRQMGQRARAYQEAVRATRLHPNEADAWKLRGGEAAALGQWTEAEQSLRQALTLRPDDWRTQLGLGGVLLRLRRAAAAFACYRQAFRLAPDEPMTARALVWASAQAAIVPDDLLQNADLLYAYKRLPEARQVYLTTLAHDPKSARALQGIGLILAAQGKQEAAFYYLETATRLNPGLPQAQALLAEWYLETAFSKEAVRRLEWAVRTAPDNAAYWHLLGRAYGALEVRNNAAEDAYRRAVALEPQNPLYRLDLADMLVINSKTMEAEEAYRRAVALAPHDPDALSRLGGFLLDQPPTPARRQEAERVLQEAVARDRDSDFAFYQLGRLRFESGDAKGAITPLSRAVALVPEIPETWYLLSRAYARAGDSLHAQAALRNFQQWRRLYMERTHTSELVKARPGDGGLRLKLARLYARNGENAKAISQYSYCLQLNPGNADARRELHALKARLKASGHLPSMALFRAMVASAAPAH